jgi:hypothetical protein
MPADSTYFAVANPLSHPLHRAGLEAVFTVCFGLTLAHALGRWRAGARHALLAWLSALAYGIFIELIAYTFLDNYHHAQFTIQLYHRLCPLYVVFVYPVFLYTGLQLVERWQLGPVAEALLAGLAMCLIDMPYDIAGAGIGWWVWSPADRNLAVRWNGVPVTSYYWYLIFGACYAGLIRLARRRATRAPLWVHLALTPPIGLGVIVFGTLGFFPFHGLVALGVRDDAVVLAHIVLCAGLALAVRPRALAPAARGLVAVPLLLAVWDIAVIAVSAGAPRPLAAALAAALGVLALVRPPRRLPAAAPIAEQEAP